MLMELGKRIDEHSESCNKETENMKQKLSELINTIIEMENTLEGVNSRSSDKKRMHKRSGRWNDGKHPIRTEKGKTNLKNDNSLRALWDNIKHINIWNIEVPGRINTRRNTSGHIVIKLTKIKAEIKY